MTIEETLINKYGALLTIAQLAEILSRSVDGTRISLRTKNAWSERINAARLKIGRRVYFRTSEIAQYLANA
ncbi:MAG: DNA-binding protein [Pseudomonadota bacterium]